MKNKQELREKNKQLRKENDFHIYDSQIAQKLKNTKIYNSARNIMLFYPLTTEINILELTNDTDKTFSFPCIIDDKIVPYIDTKEYTTGKFNIPEPQNSIPQDIKTLDLIIAPALAVDLKGNRVGYGKGYYDRFIKTLDRTKTKIATVIYEEFLVDSIECDNFDEKADMIITEKRVIQL